MSSREHQLLSRIIREGTVDEVLSWGITPSDFVTSEARAMYVNLLQYHDLYKGSIVGVEAAANIFPNFQLCDDPAMHVDALCMEVRKNRLAIEGQERLKEVHQLMSVDPVEAVNQLSVIATDLYSLTGNKNTDVRMGDAFIRILRRYELIKAGHSFAVCHWPWPLLQVATGGIQPDDYIVFYGRPKSKKSWVLAYLITWCFEQKKRAIIYTKEMNADDIFTRILSCLAEISGGLRLGNLSEQEESAMRWAVQLVERAKEESALICLSGQDCADGGDTVPWLRSKLKEYKPDVCFIDGLYLMSDVKKARKDHEKVKNISQALRQTTLQTHIPIIATLQANRKAAGHNEGNLDEIAFSDSIGQDATHVFRVINENTSPATIALVTAGGREFHLNGLRVYGQVAYNFSEYGPLTDKEIESAKDKDTGDEETSTKPGTKQPANGAYKTESKAVQAATARVAQHLYGK